MMYLKHFGLSELPFGITPDTSFIYAGNAHQEALNTLLIGLASGEGFIKITGEVGTGKTLLCRRFLSTLGDEHVLAYIPNPMLEPRVLLLAIAEELGLSLPALDYHFHLVKSLNAFLLELAAKGKMVVVCIDEAQCMPIESLEALRLLSNLETEKRKLMQVVMFGQPELDEKLADPSVRQLKQRITFSYRMPGLKPVEVNNYLAHRLRVAGHTGGNVFSKAAARTVYQLSEGTPRLINIIAHKALLSAFGEGKSTVKPSHVRIAGKDTEGVRPARWWQAW
jgi:MSHA biogenesis protein MshM